MNKLNFVAPCLFGVEGILSNELKRLGIEDVRAEDGRVLFSGTPQTAARVNINSRFAERVMVLLGEFYARTFTELFDNVKALPLEKIFPKDAA
ncbi:MAG: class I SAM-dependent RNA methyltransferase, partial [Clostridia bacterium]|nr:class I SAM-dependent RNA methyltransferase [Clostridia bacterium]